MSHKSFLKGLDRTFRSLSNTADQVAGGLVCVVIDHFADLRDRLGYSGLVELDQQLQQVVLDQLGENSSLFSPGLTGVVSLVEQTEPDELRDRAGRLFRELNHHDFPLGDDSIAITVSLTFCALDLRFGSAGQMLLEAIRGAESLSMGGGNQSIEIHPTLSARQASNDDRQMLMLLMESLRKDRLEVVFQLLLPAAEDSVRSFQMLPRLRATGGSLLVAAEFLPVARKAGLLGTIDRWMLSHAIRIIDQRSDDRSFRLFINQSGELLADSDRREKLALQLESGPDIRGQLVLDFQLADAMANLKGTEAMLDLASKNGLQVCLSKFDDHSNADLLIERLHCDYLRLSPDLVHRLAEGEDLTGNLQVLTGPLRQKGIRLIAPMIEDSAVMANLWKSGVDYLQGNMIQEAEQNLRLAD
jgi:EAL domain-containing protein (putative c-di-GMP-specific phosphodiesterase class I)/GGDEF domain-containing protein